MASDAPNPRAWAVATALAAEERLDWAAWARSRYPDPDCDECCGQGGERDADVPDQWYPCKCLRPIPAPWDADAYRADCARRGVEPGPMPSLSWTGPDGFGWEVGTGDDWPWVDFKRQGVLVATWHGIDDSLLWFGRRDWPRSSCVRVTDGATAAKRAMGGP